MYGVQRLVPSSSAGQHLVLKKSFNSALKAWGRLGAALKQVKVHNVNSNGLSAVNVAPSLSMPGWQS